MADRGGGVASVSEELLGGLLNSLGSVQSSSLDSAAQRFDSLCALLFGLASAVGADVALGCFSCLREVDFVWAARSINSLLDPVAV